MPRKTAKPTIRLDILEDTYRVSFYPVSNMRRFLYKSVEIAKNDRLAFEEQVNALITESRDRFGKQGK